MWGGIPTWYNRSNPDTASTAALYAADTKSHGSTPNIMAGAFNRGYIDVPSLVEQTQQ